MPLLYTETRFLTSVCLVKYTFRYITAFTYARLLNYEKAKEAVTTSTHIAVKSVTDSTHQAISNINQVSEQAKISLEHTIEKTEALSRSLTEGIQNGINGVVKDWITQHPIVAWFLNHPIYSILILLLCIILIWGLLQAIGGLVVKSWTSVLISPLKLLQPVLNFSSKSVGTAINNRFIPLKLDSNDPKEKFNMIINRLNEIKQEQANLLQELENLLEVSDLNFKTK